MIDFLVVDAPSAYNAILGRGTLNAIGAVVSTSHLMMKFIPTEAGVGVESGHHGEGMLFDVSEGEEGACGSS